ncbi:MAG: hypothetical protein FH748_13465 [Balneolaceae bacterium]|nr:hypothetical protein [Balneolaceae bacterium]
MDKVRDEINTGLDIEIQEQEQYLIANVSGEWSLDRIKKMIDLVVSESKKREKNLFLLDMLQTGPPRKEMDRFYIGEYVAFEFHPALKVAVVSCQS